MTRESNRKYEVAGIILATAAVISQIVTIFTIFKEIDIAQISIINWLGIVCNSAAVILALLYLIAGYRKRDANLYKGFLISYAVAILVSIPSVIDMAQVRPLATKTLVLVLVISFAILMALTTAKDLGQKISLQLAWINFGVSLVTLIGLAIFLPGLLRGGTMVETMLKFIITKFHILSFVLVVAIRCKYVDKAERGRKC